MVRIILLDRMAYSVSSVTALAEYAWFDKLEAAGFKVKTKHEEYGQFNFKLCYYIDFQNEAEAALFKLTYL
jgi:hypothetical protein